MLHLKAASHIEVASLLENEADYKSLASEHTFSVFKAKSDTHLSHLVSKYLDGNFESPSLTKRHPSFIYSLIIF